ncbi:hypothetical protein RFI_00351 [Reticulomyxa filosa]|uniref:Uncharacterized protein n=1 Tax=Reticulomyxa filosa TaxID=46433 RepID=X6PDW7_RETFI|nr:hypothetical protein RFI_00351 [Reticulomyxa filosa]|eukprot:ETO36710.1 hypothetical protein RFI_00351 [Reticulomyxa filosa]
MASGSDLPESGPSTGEDWIDKDNPKELLTWLAPQKELEEHLQKLFLYALRRGKWSCASALLKNNGWLSRVCDDLHQNIIFYWADGMQCNSNIEEAIKWLDEYVSFEAIKQMLKEPNGEGSTIFHAVAATGQCRVMEWIQYKLPELDVNQTNKYGYTALHKAARYGQAEAISWLLKHGADVSLVTINGDRPEHEALKCGYIELINWPASLNCEIQISLQARYDRAQAIRLSFPKQRLIEKEASEYHLNQLSSCCPEYKKLIMRSMQSVPQLAIACLLALSDAILSHLPWTSIENESGHYRQAMGYAAAASTIAIRHLNSSNALLWQKQSSTQKNKNFVTKCCQIQLQFHLHCTTQWSEDLMQLRRQCKTSEDNTKRMTKELCTILKTILEICFKSIACSTSSLHIYIAGTWDHWDVDEATPYSDIECACLIEEDNTNIPLIGLEETPEELLYLFDGCDEQPQIIRSGLHADFLYMPHRNPDVLIHTPTNLVNVQRDQNFTFLDRQILLSFQKIDGSDQLFSIYQESLYQCLNTNIGSWLKSHRLQERLSSEIVQQIVEDLNPMSQAANALEDGHIRISVKRQLYRLPQQIILALTLYYGLRASHVIDQLNALASRRLLCDQTVQLLRELIHTTLKWRIKTQMHYQTADEWLYQPDAQVVFLFGCASLFPPFKRARAIKANVCNFMAIISKCKAVEQ